jgi:hypothetical protein
MMSPSFTQYEEVIGYRATTIPFENRRWLTQTGTIKHQMSSAV